MARRLILTVAEAPDGVARDLRLQEWARHRSMFEEHSNIAKTWNPNLHRNPPGGPKAIRKMVGHLLTFDIRVIALGRHDEGGLGAAGPTQLLPNFWLT